MSLHEDSGSGYDDPIHDLDDHRQQIPSVQRPERQRRGTFDSLYAAANLDDVTGGRLHKSYSRRQVDEAVEDDDSENSQCGRRSRRPTVDTAQSIERDPSPPNSIKAFAEARRRMSVTSIQDDCGSFISRRSFKSRHQTIQEDDASMKSCMSAEEDVCFPLQEEHRKDKLYIDFEYLQDFIAQQAEEARNAQDHGEGVARSFPDLVQAKTEAEYQNATLVTSDGDFVGPAPCIMPEKASLGDSDSGKAHAPNDKAKLGPDMNPHQVVDPNKFSFFSSVWESTSHAPTLGGLLFDGEDVRSLFTFPKDEAEGVWWLNMSNPTEDEIRAICRSFGIHPLTIEDIITQEAREKIELFPSYYLASFRSFTIERDETGIEYEPFNVYVVVFREGTLSFSFQPNSHASHVRKRIALLKDYVALSSDWICYALIDHIVDSFAPVINRLERDTDQVEDEVFVARAEDMSEFLKKIGLLRKQIMSLGRLLNGKADVLRSFTKRCTPDYQIAPRLDIGLYLGDIQDHILTMQNSLQHFEKILGRTHSNYIGYLTIESISNGTRVNNVLSKITLLGSIIVPLNLICGLFGMNVAVPFMDVHNTNAFWGIVGVIILSTIAMITTARWRRYI